MGKLTAISIRTKRDETGEMHGLRAFSRCEPRRSSPEGRRRTKAPYPLSEKKRASERRMSFTRVAELCIESHRAGWTPKHTAEWTATLARYVYPHIGNLDVSTIDAGEITSWLEPLRHTKPDAASRLRCRIEAILDFAKARGWRTGEKSRSLERTFVRVASVHEKSSTP